MTAHRFLVGLILWLLLLPSAQAEPRLGVQIEVSFLLGYVEGAGCSFYRNGSWYDSRSAQAHLREKYMFLVARNMINSTDDFIDLVATESSLSGQPYAVKCADGASVSSNRWLREELVRYRKFQ